MGLLDLPPELLDLIISFACRPHSIEGLALSCRTVYERATSQIARHNALKRQWSHATNTQGNRRADTLRIVYEIARDPVIAEYIESLSLWDRRKDDELVDGQDGDTDSFRDDEDAMASIKHLLQHTGYFAAAGDDSWWHQLLEEDADDADEEEGNSDKLYATMALLALLPSLKTLQLPDKWHQVRATEAAEELVPAVEALVSLSRAKDASQAPLRYLDTILPFSEEGYDVRVGLQCLQSFMLLPNLKNLFLVSCIALEDDWAGVQFNWPPSVVHSSLARIELACCCVDAQGLAALVRNTPQLTVFKYSHQTKWDGLEYDWNPGEFIEVLATYCGHQLIDLALTVDELHGEIVNGLSSFARFPALQTLEVDADLFCGPPVESGQRRGRDAYVPDGAKEWAYDDIPCLGDMLPPNIRTVYLNSDYPEPSQLVLKALVKNIKDRRCETLLHLERMVIRQYRSSTAKELCLLHECILESFDEESMVPRARAMMPLWKRQFDAFVGGIVSEGFRE